MLSEYDKNEEDLFIICKSNDSSFDGEFYLGVLSTKIYCLPSCKAKMPLRKNIKFFKEKGEAINEGLRGCKRCRSEFYPLTQPLWLNPLLTRIRELTNRKLEDDELEKIANVNISTIRRYFKSYLGSTLGDFHRKIRLQYAYELIMQATPILDLPYMTGFSSLSGFRSAFQKEFGKTPGEVKNDG
ncbi:MAG: Ada metal-binding domain-containing protein [Candidatus Kariarchaeaceae archaeon]|jgi:methylphosphotriester-DNA--protein-cysteine methyltransferase